MRYRYTQLTADLCPGPISIDAPPPKGKWKSGERGRLFQGTREQMSKNEGNRVTKAILGNKEHSKSVF